MKFLPALFALTLLPLVALGQNASRPTSFVGVPWGASPDESMRILAARTGLALPEEGAPAGDTLELTGGKFAGQDVAKWTLSFANGKLHSAAVVLKNPGSAASLYRELKQLLIAKYGPVAAERKPDSGTEADRRLRRERRRSNPDLKTYGSVASWRFSPTLNDKERKVIELELAGPDGGEATDETQLGVTVRYVNESLKPSETPASPTPTKAEPAKPAVKVDDL